MWVHESAKGRFRYTGMEGNEMKGSRDVLEDSSFLPLRGKMKQIHLRILPRTAWIKGSAFRKKGAILCDQAVSREYKIRSGFSFAATGGGIGTQGSCRLGLNHQSVEIRSTDGLSDGGRMSNEQGARGG